MENADKRAETAFRTFLNDAGCQSTEFWFFTESELDYWLSKFWYGARQLPQNDSQEEGEMYSVNSLKGLMYGINRVLKKFGHEFDIGKSQNFRKSQEAFKNAVKELRERLWIYSLSPRNYWRR